MQHASKGAAALAASDGTTAVAAYTKALIEHPNSPDYFVQRSTAFTRLKPARHDLALKDAEYAVLLGRKRAKREKIQAAQQRRVVSLYGLGRYADAKFILDTMVQWRPKDSKKDKMEGDMWSARVDSKLKNVPEVERVVFAKEYPDVELPDEKQMKDMLMNQLKSDGTYRYDGEEDSVLATQTIHSDSPAASTSTNGAAPANQPAGEKTATTATPPITTTSCTSAPAKIRHEWYQNAQSVILTIYAKGVHKEKAEIDIQDDSVSITFPQPSDPASDFTFVLDPLFALIDAFSSKGTVMSTKVEVVLKKVIPGQKWPSLEGTVPLRDSTNEAKSNSSATKAAMMATLQQQPQSNPNTVPSYPTSSRSGPKNWDKVASDLTKKQKKSNNKKNKSKDKRKGSSGSDSEDDVDDDDGDDSDFDSGDPADSFFKKLYANSDPDTRRAMMKSFQESGGTALSTNWSEVGKGRVEPVKSKDEV